MLKKLNPNYQSLVKKLQDFNNGYFKIKKFEIRKQKRHFIKFNLRRSQFCKEMGIGINLMKDLCEKEFRIETKDGQGILTE